MGPAASPQTASKLPFATGVRIVCVVLLFLVACGGESPAPARVEARKAPACPQEWTAVAGGVEYRMLDCDLHLVRVDPRKARIDAVVRMGSTARDHAANAVFAINTNFFDESFRPIGVVMSKGRELNRPHPVSWQSVFYVDEAGSPGILPVREWKNVRDPVTAVQCGPRLVVRGERNDVARAQPASRSGVCIDGDEKVVFFATAPEARFDVTQMVDLAATRLRCRDAMLFDGGPSVQMHLHRDSGDVSVEGDKRVPAYIVVRD